MQFLKNYKRCKKSERYQTCNSQSKKKILVSKPNYHKTVLLLFFKFISHLNENNTDTHKQINLISSINIRIKIVINYF